MYRFFPLFLFSLQAHALDISSDPDALKTLHLDIDGHFVAADSPWGQKIGNDCHMRPFDLDGDTSSLSESEENYVRELVANVADRFSPWKINITTTKPDSYNEHTAHIVITNRECEGGELALFSGLTSRSSACSFGKSTALAPQLIFFNGNTSTSDASLIAKGMGHLLCLRRDSAKDRVDNWGAIMGNAVANQVQQWQTTSRQDDLLRIGEVLPLREDVEPTANLGAQVNVTGLINSRDDRDIHPMIVGDNGALVTLTISRPRAQGMLWPKLSIVRDGVVYAEKEGIDVTVDTSLSQGNYQVIIEGVAFNGVTTDDSVGEYTLTGTVVVAVDEPVSPEPAIIYDYRILTTAARATSGYAWILYPDDTKLWVTAQCRAQLVTEGLPVQVMRWPDIAIYPDRSSISCPDLSTPEEPKPPQAPEPNGLRVLTTADKSTQGYAWVVSENGQKQWISASCRASLSLPVYTVPWATISTYPDTNNVVACDDLITLQVTDPPNAAAPTTGTPTVEPQTIEPPAIEPQTIEPQTVEPQTIEPQTVEPQTIEPQTVEPQTVEPQTVEPQTIEPPTVEPQTIEPQTVDLPITDPPGAVPKVMLIDHINQRGGTLTTGADGITIYQYLDDTIVPSYIRDVYVFEPALDDGARVRTQFEFKLPEGFLNAQLNQVALARFDNTTSSATADRSGVFIDSKGIIVFGYQHFSQPSVYRELVVGPPAVEGEWYRVEFDITFHSDSGRARTMMTVSNETGVITRGESREFNLTDSEFVTRLRTGLVSIPASHPAPLSVQMRNTMVHLVNPS